MNRAIPCVTAALLALVTTIPASASKSTDTAVDARVVLRSLSEIPEKGIPPRLFRDAAGIAVIPGVIKAGFVVGGRHGRGLLSVKNDAGAWSLPTYISMTGGSIGFQAGVQSIDVVLVFKTQRSVQDIVDGKFTLGADASVAAGPVGREASAATDTQLKAEIFAYSRARGLFAGISLDGSVLEIDHKGNAEAYGAGATAATVFQGNVSQRPGAAVGFVDSLEELTAQARASAGE